MTLVLDYWLNVRRVRAVRRIEDCPAARHPASVRRGQVGTLEDIDFCADLLVVDFGEGAILPSAHLETGLFPAGLPIMLV